MTIKNRPLKNVRGFTLVELLVSLVISAVIFGGVVQVAVSGKRSALDGEEVSFIQDNARFVVDQLKRDARAAGFMGCAGAGSATRANVIADDVNGFINLDSGVQGFDDSVANHPAEYLADVKAGTDSFIVRFADASQEYQVKTHSEATSTFTLWDSIDVEQGATYLATDSTCRNVALFASSGTGSSTSTINHGGTENCSDVIKRSLETSY